MTDQITTKPFQSQAQWRWAMATDQPFAHRWAHETPGGKKRRFRRLPVKKKSYTLDTLERYIASPGYDPAVAQVIAAHIPELPRFKGTPIAPGITRIRGDLCNVHGKYGSCAEATGGAKPTPLPKPAKPGKGRAPRKPLKPKKTDAERTAEHDAKRTEREAKREEERRAADVAKRAERDRILTESGIDKNLQGALLDAREGNTLTATNGAALVSRGLAEQATDGSYRLNASGREVVNAAMRGDAGRVRDTLSAAQDAAGKRAAGKPEKPPKASGGGKGGGAKPPDPEKARAAQDRARAQIVRDAAQRTRQAQQAASRQQRETERQARQTRQQRLDQQRDADRARRIAREDARDAERRQRKKATETPQPTRVLSGGNTGVMVALYPDATAAKQLAALDGVTESIEQMHLTLCFLGDSTETPLSSNKDRLVNQVAEWAAQHGQALKGTINGLGRFFHAEEDGTNAVFVSPDVPGLPELRQSLVEAIEQAGFDYAQNHGFTPHITVAYVSHDAPTPPIRIETPVTFDRATLAWGDEQYDFPLGQMAGKSFTVFKDAAGHWRWVAISSTAYQDRDGEIVSTKALADDVARADGDGQYGPLRWWHAPSLDLGDCDFNAMDDRVLIESGTFKSEGIARKVARHADQLEVSLGFVHPPTEPDANGVFHHIRRFERSLTPKGKASNLFTSFRVKETPMLDTVKKAALKQLGFGDDEITALEQQSTATQKTADTAGVAFKADEPIEPQPPEEITLNGVVYTVKAAPPPAAAAPMDPEDVADQGVDEAAEGEPPLDDAAGGLTLSPEDLQALGEVISASLQSALGPLVQAMNVVGTMSSGLGELKTMMGGYATQETKKDAERAALAETVKTQGVQLAELLGDQSAVPYRPSQSAETQLNPFNPADHALLAAATTKDQDQPTDTDPFADLRGMFFGNNGTP